MRRRKPFIVRYGWLGLAATAGIVGAVWFTNPLRIGKHAQPLPGYVTEVAALDREYATFQGTSMQDNDVRAQFQQAADLASRGEYNGALLLLETVAKKAALPVVFNDMGVLYALLGDRARATNAFRDALARDLDYAPVRRNLERLEGFTSNAADPVSAEIEPNNDIANANVIAIGRPVEAEISALGNDIDVFKVISPPAPRDLLAIHVENRSQTLAPRLSVYDDEGTILPWGKDQEQAGGSLTQVLAPKPNTTMFLYIYGFGSSSGAYTLTVKALKAFDSYEPNDDIHSASKIRVGQEIQANIMDADDTDFYSFVSPYTGTLSIDIGNRSTTLIPALSTFTPDMRPSGFSPEIRTPGGSLHHTMTVEQGNTYYIQVRSQGKSSGDYSLKLQ